MPRVKVKLEYIFDDPIRKATFKNRKKGFIKKMSEFTTLCGVDACAIIYSQSNAETSFYPSIVEVLNVVSRFDGISEKDRTKKLVNRHDILCDKMAEAYIRLEKEKKKTVNEELKQIMFNNLENEVLDKLDMITLGSLREFTSNYLEDIKALISHKTNNLN